MPLDTVEMTYAFYTELENERFSRLERMLGVVWTYEDVMRVQDTPKKTSETEAAPPSLLGPGGKVFYPLSSALNPQLMQEIRKRFRTGLGNAFGDEGIDGQTTSLFNTPKNVFRKLMGDDSTVDEDEFDVRQDAVKFVPKR